MNLNVKNSWYKIPNKALLSESLAALALRKARR
jgi:hypothetical protein